MTTLRPNASLWRRTRNAVLAGLIALSTVLTPAGVALALDSGSTSSLLDTSSTDGTGGAFAWEGESLSDATAIVSSDGTGLNLRAEPSREGEVIARIPDGTVVELRIDDTDTVYDPDGVTRWWPVAFDGQDGWVAGTYLVDAGGLAPGTVAFDVEGGTLLDATAMVNAEEGLRLRAEPADDADALVTIPNGTVIELRIDETDTVYDPDGITRWWPASYDGQSGWVSGFYLTSTDGPAPAAPTDAAAPAAPAQPRGQFTWSGGALEGATAIAAGDGQNVNVRVEPSESSDILTTVADGTVIELRIDRADSVVGPDGETRWWPVEVNGVDGWISGFFLTGGASAPAASSDGSLFPAGSTAIVQTQTGRGAKLRSGAGSEGTQIGSVPERSEVMVLSGPVSQENSQNGWFEIEYNGQTGYIDGDLLVLVATPVATTPATQPAQPTEPTEGSTEPAQQPTEPAATEAPSQPGATEPAEQPAQPSATTAPGQPTPTPEPEEPRQTPVAGETPTPGPTPTPRPTQPPAQSGSAFILPVNGAVQTQGFGCSSLGFYPYNPDWGCGVHDGIDYAAPAYTPIVAVADGTVVTAGWCDCGLGYYVEIDHGNNVHTIYGHMATQPYVSVGQRVTQGQEIGPIGSTGLSTGPHVHFMVQVNGVSQDPSRYLP